MPMQRVGIGSCTATTSRQHATFIDFNGWHTNATIHGLENVWIIITRYVS